MGSKWVAGSKFPTGGIGGQQKIQKCLKVCLSELISICQVQGLKALFCHYIIQIERMLNMMMGYSTCGKWKNNGTCTCLKDLIQSRINALNKSMMEWFKKYEPGFMCVGRKPHPFDNERHTICCGLPSMLWRAQIV